MQVFLLSLLDLPFSISPVVTGLMLTLLFGRTGWFGPLLKEMGVNVVFAFGGKIEIRAACCHLAHALREAVAVLRLRAQALVCV